MEAIAESCPLCGTELSKVKFSEIQAKLKSQKLQDLAEQGKRMEEAEATVRRRMKQQFEKELQTAKEDAAKLAKLEVDQQIKKIAAERDEAAKKAIIIGIDSAADSKAFTSFLQTDNVQGGRVGADGLAAAIAAKYGKPEGDVALITSIPGVGSLDQRAKGFKEEIAAKYPGLKLVADKVADGMATTALNIMTDLITANPDLRGVFASNLIMAQGAGQAIAENKVADKIKLVGFDSDDKLVKLLSDGSIVALVVQDPYNMGYLGVKTALAASKGEKVPATVDTGVNLITKENMNSARSQELLSPKVT